MKKLFPAFTLCLWVLGAAAQSWKDADAAYSRGDYAAALQALRPLADQGDSQAQYNLGYLYYSGKGVPQDYGEAVKWYSKAASQGVDSAQYNLGFMYSEGQGVSQDYGEAVRLYREAAERGNVNAQVNLSLMYFQGRGVPQDFVLAHMWVNLAAARAPDKEVRDKAAQNRDLVASKMTAAQVAEAQKLAREWKPTTP